MVIVLPVTFVAAEVNVGAGLMVGDTVGVGTPTPN